jgi:hypothetical protein
MYNQEIEKLKNDIQEIEDRIEENEDFIFEEEFENLNDSVIAQEEEIRENLKSYFDRDVINEKTEALVHKQLKELSKLKNRITDIQSQAGKVSNEDIRDIMFPDGEDD